MKSILKLTCAAGALALAGLTAPAYANHHEGEGEKGQSATGECASSYGQSRAAEAKAAQKPKKRKGKNKGEKGGAEDINIGIGELQEDCMEPGAMGEIKKSSGDEEGKRGKRDDDDGDDEDENEDSEKGGTQDINIGIGEMQECMEAATNKKMRKACRDKAKDAAIGELGDRLDDDNSGAGGGD